MSETPTTLATSADLFESSVDSLRFMSPLKKQISTSLVFGSNTESLTSMQDRIALWPNQASTDVYEILPVADIMTRNSALSQPGVRKSRAQSDPRDSVESDSLWVNASSDSFSYAQSCSFRFSIRDAHRWLLLNDQRLRLVCHFATNQLKSLHVSSVLLSYADDMCWFKLVARVQNSEDDCDACVVTPSMLPVSTDELILASNIVAFPAGTNASSLSAEDAGVLAFRGRRISNLPIQGSALRHDIAYSCGLPVDNIHILLDDDSEVTDETLLCTARNQDVEPSNQGTNNKPKESCVIS